MHPRHLFSAMFHRSMHSWSHWRSGCGGEPDEWRFGPRGSDAFGGDGPRGGRMGGAGFRRRGGRMFDHGDLRLLVLALVSTAPRHGYELIKLIEDKFGGSYAPSPGAIYPTLSLLEEQDLVQAVAEEGSNKRRYAITDAGRAYLAENQAAVDGLLNRIELLSRMAAGEPIPERIAQAMHTLKRVLMERGRGSTGEIERIAAAIERAAREIAESSGKS
jgi:DNA-binding PadR family transcriptional regulator